MKSSFWSLTWRSGKRIFQVSVRRKGSSDQNSRPSSAASCRRGPVPPTPQAPFSRLYLWFVNHFWFFNNAHQHQMLSSHILSFTRTLYLWLLWLDHDLFEPCSVKMVILFGRNSDSFSPSVGLSKCFIMEECYPNQPKSHNNICRVTELQYPYEIGESNRIDCVRWLKEMIHVKH